MLRVENICKTFFAGTINEKKALQGLSLHLKPGDFVTVIGGNGAGKSTLMNSIAGVFPIDSGKIIIDGNDITKTPEHKRAKYIGRVFQDPMMGTAAGMMIEENLAIAARRGKTPGLKWGLDSDNQTWFSELLQTQDLANLADRADLVQVARRRRIGFEFALRGQEDGLSVLHCRFQCANRHHSAHIKVDDHIRERRQSAQRQHRQAAEDDSVKLCHMFVSPCTENCLLVSV